MNSDEASTVVRRYYAAFRAGGPLEVAEALGAVLAPDFVLDSPLVRDRIGAPATGAVATAIAVDAAVALQHAELETLHFATDNDGVVALIRLPTARGEVWQSEHFDLAPAAGTITRLRSYYDPRLLLRPPTDQTGQ